MSDRIWEPGELVVERHVFRGEVRFGAPMWLVAAIAVALTFAMGTLGWSSARAQADPKEVRTDKEVYVAGRDPGIAFEGTLSGCANSEVTLALYRRGPASHTPPCSRTSW